MVEYIDKEELLRELERKIKEDNERRMAVVDRDFIDLVNDATVIEDVVEVVRCEDCVRRRDEMTDCGLYVCTAWVHPHCVRPDDYCSYGERKEQK